MKFQILGLSWGALTALSLVLTPTGSSAQSIEELKRQVEVLKDRIDGLEKKQQEKEGDRTAAQPTVSSGEENIRLELSGQVNRGVLYVDNGPTEEFFHVDNDNSSTRVRFIGSGHLDEDFSVGTQIEVQFESNSTAAIRIDQDSPAGPNNFTERKLELYADSKRLGRLWLGQGDTASNGTSEVDVSGTSVIGYSGIADMASGIAFAEEGTGTLGPRIGQVYNQFDGLSRSDRIRYDTPKFMGFQASASAVDGGLWDGALRFSGEVSDTVITAAAAYANSSSGGGFEQVNGSASVLFPVGISITAAAGTRFREDDPRDDPVTYYGKLGYTFNWTDLGPTSIAADFGNSDDVFAQGDEFMTYGFLAVQRLRAVATELYLGIRQHELDSGDGRDFDDILAVLTGARIKF